MQQITLEPIKSFVELKCPHCKQPIYRVFEHDSEALQALYKYRWLGDYTIPNLKSVLSIEQKTPNGFFYQLTVGSQDCCNKSYYVVKCWFINAEVSGKWKEISDFFDEHADGKQARLINYIALYQGDNQFVPSQWIVTQSPSPKGVIQSHFLGPFLALNEDSEDFFDEDFRDVNSLLTSGQPNMWLASRELLFILWDDLRALVKQPVRI